LKGKKNPKGKKRGKTRNEEGTAKGVKGGERGRRVTPAKKEKGEVER